MNPGLSMDYIFITASASSAAFFPMRAGRRTSIFDPASERAGFKKMLATRIQSGQKQFVFFADKRLKREILREKLPLWLQEVRETALDCDFHYAGVFTAAGIAKASTRSEPS